MRCVGILLATILFVSGCASTRLARAPVTPAVQVAVAQRLRQSPPPARHTPASEMLSVVTDVDKRVWKAAVSVCERTFSNPQDCSAIMLQRTLTVMHEEPDINAYVGSGYDLTILGGLVAAAGSDDEIAMVLAHEYAHALLGHVASSNANSGLGALVGLAAGIALATTVASDAENATDIITGGAQVGTRYGDLAFSEGMELEADHLGMFILHEAGYDISRSSDFFLRMISIQRDRERSGQEGVLGFLRTHPSDADRIHNLLATENMIKLGARRPLPKQ